MSSKLFLSAVTFFSNLFLPRLVSFDSRRHPSILPTVLFTYAVFPSLQVKCLALLDSSFTHAPCFPDLGDGKWNELTCFGCRVCPSQQSDGFLVVFDQAGWPPPGELRKLMEVVADRDR